MPPPTCYRVPAERAGTKLDRLIQDVAQVSRRQARLLIAAGRVRVNQRAVRILARPIGAGVHIEISAQPAGASTIGDNLEKSSNRQSRPWRTPSIVYLDRYVVAIDKPAGLLSETDSFASPSLQSVVPKLLRALGEHDKLWLVHRLDAGTSGIIIMARTPGAAAHLGNSFRDAKVHKTYLALCTGVLGEVHTLDACIARDRGSRHRVAASGRPAQTLLQPVVSAPGVTLVCARPKTGRTHQIRVHTAHLGHPIIGDRLYGGPGYAPAAGHHAPILRPMLHALRLEIDHPKQARRLHLQSHVPEDFLQTARLFGLTLPKSMHHV